MCSPDVRRPKDMMAALAFTAGDLEWAVWLLRGVGPDVGAELCDIAGRSPGAVWSVMLWVVTSGPDVTRVQHSIGCSCPGGVAVSVATGTACVVCPDGCETGARAADPSCWPTTTAIVRGAAPVTVVSSARAEAERCGKPCDSRPRAAREWVVWNLGHLGVSEPVR